jgi:capsular exopolysaccharide synthesis family protein
VGSQADRVLIGGGISFAATEAYKLLRTKLQYSFADENGCRVIGVSSALSGEGKSLSSINLAYALSQLDKKVLLIDCDMRRPSISSKLPIDKHTGLSGYLSGLHHINEIVQDCGLRGEETAFDIISSGNNPPNPIELLSSARMAKLLNALRKVYDYVIMDLPPVSEVSDALVVAKQADGILLVVRRNYSEKAALSLAVRQFAFVEARMLGFIYNCAVQVQGTYAKSYYKRTYKKYAGKFAADMTNAASNQEKR